MEQKGTVVLNLSPTAANPRNSEGAFLTMNDGRIMFAYSSFVGQSNHDDANANVVVRYSYDNGFTWSDETIIATPQEHDALNIMSVRLAIRIVLYRRRADMVEGNGFDIHFTSLTSVS